MKTLKIIGIIVLAIVAGLVIRTCSTAGAVVDEVVNAENIITSYEEFENKYAACQEICDKITVLNQADPEDSKEAGFSVSERKVALENQLARWIREYNADSRKITKNLWKSNSLPYKLERSEFNCQ